MILELRLSRLLAILWTLLCLGTAGRCFSQSWQSGSAFTYQGRLLFNATPANGLYDFKFTLYDDTGTELSSVTPSSPITVADGLFVVDLDFSSGAPFDGQVLWLEIATKRHEDGGEPITLTPRTKITPSPYAIRAKAVAADAITSLSIRDGSIATADIRDGAITAPKIASGAVTAAKIASGAVSNSSIASGANIDWAKINPAGADTRYLRADTNAQQLPGYSIATSNVTAADYLGLLLGSDGNFATLGIGLENADPVFQYRFAGNLLMGLESDGTLRLYGPDTPYVRVYDDYGVHHVTLQLDAGAGYPIANLSSDRDLHIQALTTFVPGESGFHLGGNYGSVSTFSVWDAAIYSKYETHSGGTPSSYCELRVVDGVGNDTRISSHADPRVKTPSAVATSFDNPNVELPFSFNHSNRLLGKGATVDMAKIVAFVEKKMIQELGEEAGRVIYSYELPADERDTVEKLYDRSALEAVEKDLRERPTLEVTLGSDGTLPSESWEEIDEVVQRATGRKKTVREIDWNTKRIITRELNEAETESAPTGRKISRLREGYRFEDGKLLRRRTVEDVDIGKLAQPELPDWLKRRLPAGSTEKVELDRHWERATNRAVATLRERQSGGKPEMKIAQAPSAPAVQPVEHKNVSMAAH